VSFSFIWDEWVGVDVAEHWLNVRQGRYQTMGSWWNSHYETRKRRSIKGILIVFFLGGGEDLKKEMVKNKTRLAIEEVLRNLLHHVF
jgi:hypothetical protein